LIILWETLMTKPKSIRSPFRAFSSRSRTFWQSIGLVLWTAGLGPGGYRLVCVTALHYIKMLNLLSRFHTHVTRWTDDTTDCLYFFWGKNYTNSLYQHDYTGYCCSHLHRLELLRQAQEKEVNGSIKLTGKQPATIEITRGNHSRRHQTPALKSRPLAPKVFPTFIGKVWLMVFTLRTHPC